MTSKIGHKSIQSILMSKELQQKQKMMQGNNFCIDWNDIFISEKFTYKERNMFEQSDLMNIIQNRTPQNPPRNKYN